jgi:hypothetical protein
MSHMDGKIISPNSWVSSKVEAERCTHSFEDPGVIWLLACVLETR